MLNEGPLKPEETEFENRLRRLAPGGHHLRRDTLMFAAGQRAARRQARLWQAASCALLLGVALPGWHGLNSGSETEPPVQARIEEPAGSTVPPYPGAESVDIAPSRSGAVFDYLRLRRRLVRDGGDALPAPPAYAPRENAVESMAEWHRTATPDRTRAKGFPIPNFRTQGDPS